MRGGGRVGDGRAGDGRAGDGPSGTAARILHVEDDEVDAEALRRAFERAGSPRPILRARDGAEALRLVRGGGGDGAPPLARPYVVLLDLRLPGLGGLDVLAALRADDATRDVPVFALSTSGAWRHRRKAYGLGIAGYLVKTDDEGRLALMARMLDDYCGLVSLP